MAGGKKKGIFLRKSIFMVSTSVLAVFLMHHAMQPEPVQQAPIVMMATDTSSLRNGDLLFRNGNGTESWFVTGISNGNYSHIAIACKGENGWMAVHAVPGESESIRDTDFLKCEPIEAFYQPQRACSGAFARVDCHDTLAQKALDFALDKVRRRFAFDHSYKLNDTSQYYCTELIYRAYLQVGINLAADRRHEIPMPGTDGRFIFPSDILESTHIAQVTELKTSTEETNP